MNRFILTLLFLFFVRTFLFTQEFEVRSFTKDSKDISAIRFPRKDVNNQSGAIIKVRTNLQGLNYNCNSGFIGDPFEKDGDIWLYVSPKEKRIKFMKEGFLALDYYIEEVIEPSTVYILELINKFQAPVKAGASLGFVLIKSDPTGAEVKVNEEPTGSRTPFQKPLNPGQYSYELTKHLYLIYTGTFIISAGKTTTVENKLEPNFGTLSIISQPEAGADIYLDNRLLEQKTPALLEQIPSGQHKIVVRKELYETQTQDVEILNGQTTRLSITLYPTFGEIEVTAPKDVEIWIDQQPVGIGSFSGRVLKGIHLIEAKKLNYHDFSETITVDIGKKHLVNIAMTPKTGILTIMTTPPEADVYLDGQPQGISPVILQDILIGQHTLRFSKKGYGETTKLITLLKDQTLEVAEVLLLSREETYILQPHGDDNHTPLPELVFIEGGTFQMGSGDGNDDEQPIHTVFVDDFHLAKYEVTQKQWFSIMGTNPSYFNDCDNCPVESVSWVNVQEFLAKLNEKTGQNFRLPTEAEWEYAARGGKYSRGYQYSGSNSIANVAWYNADSTFSTHQVGQKLPNELELFDMTGNVWEWCSDIYGPEYYSRSPSYMPRGASIGSFRSMRGGSWGNSPDYSRTTVRFRLPSQVCDGYGGSIGFRICRND